MCLDDMLANGNDGLKEVEGERKGVLEEKIRTGR